MSAYRRTPQGGNYRAVVIGPKDRKVFSKLDVPGFGRVGVMSRDAFEKANQAAGRAINRSVASGFGGVAPEAMSKKDSYGE